jgi:hypothetical protein
MPQASYFATDKSYNLSQKQYPLTETGSYYFLPLNLKKKIKIKENENRNEKISPERAIRKLKSAF